MVKTERKILIIRLQTHSFSVQLIFLPIQADNSEILILVFQCSCLLLAYAPGPMTSLDKPKYHVIGRSAVWPPSAFRLLPRCSYHSNW